MKSLEGNLVDVALGEVYPARITFDGKIEKIERLGRSRPSFILPGLIDAHLHIESTMLCPSRFCEAVLPHGTVAVVADPHEIANVAGVRGVRYMLEDTPGWSKLAYTAPSCVPATPFETSGAKLGVEEVEELLQHGRVVALGEVMDFPGVLRGDKEIIGKIRAARRLGKPVDGHAPGLRGKELGRYIAAGITTDHEVMSPEEGREKLSGGMKLMLRHGSTSRDLPALVGLAREFPNDCFLVSDDKHVGELVKEGHVDALLREAVGLGLDPLLAVRCCTLNPARHYGLETGILEEGRPADFVVVGDLKGFGVLEVWVNGRKLVKRGEGLARVRPKRFPPGIERYELTEGDFSVKGRGKRVRVRVIEVFPGQILTRAGVEELRVERGVVLPDERRRIAYLAVVNRYRRAPVARAFAKGLFLDGAIASSVAHDSHNLVVAGSSARDMCGAVKAVMPTGGLALSRRGKIHLVPLPIAGLMSGLKVGVLTSRLERLHRLVEEAGCELPSPFMQLSFLTLLVIPELRLSDRGLFDSKKFEFVDLSVGR